MNNNLTIPCNFETPLGIEVIYADTPILRACAAYAAILGGKSARVASRGGVGHDHVCAIFADSAPSNVCEFPIIGDRGISADIC